MKLGHLSAGEHAELARLLTRVQEDLKEATIIVKRAPFTDAVMRCQKRVQEALIDPLHNAWDAANPERYRDQPYPSVYYAVHR